MKVFLSSKRKYLAWRIAGAARSRAGQYDVIHYHGHFHLLGQYMGAAAARTVMTLHDYAGVCPTKMAFRDGQICDLGPRTPCGSCLYHVEGGLRSGLTAMSVGSWRRAVRQAIERTTVLAVSGAVKEMYERALGTLPVQVVPNFVDEQRMDQVGSPVDLHEQYGIPVDRPVAVIASTMQPEKGVLAFLESFTQLPGRRPAVLVVGYGPELSEIKARFTGTDVVCTGWLPYMETLRHIAGADLFVVTSLWAEPSTTTIMEAHFCGVPVYAMNRGGIAQVMEWSGGPGAVCDDIPALARQVARASCRETTRGVPGGYRLSVNQVLPRIRRVYEQVLSTR